MSRVKAEMVRSYWRKINELRTVKSKYLNTITGLRINHLNPLSSFILLHSFIQAISIELENLSDTGDMVLNKNSSVSKKKIAVSLGFLDPLLKWGKRPTTHKWIIHNQDWKTCFQRYKPEYK